MQYLGDYTEDYATLNFKFSTHKADGTPISLAGSPVVKVYKANSIDTETATGVTLTVDFDTVTGLNNVLIDLSADAFYVVANDYSIVITTGTVNAISVVGTVLAHFSIENRNIKANLISILGTALTETTGQIAAAFKKFFNIAFPTGTINSLPDAVPDANGGLPLTNGTKLNKTVDLTAGQTIAATVSDKTGFSLSATGADLILKSSTFIQAIVAAINELATYGLTALNTLLVTTGIKAASIPAATLVANQHVIVDSGIVTTLTNVPTDMALNSTVMKETSYVVPPSVATIADAVWDEAVVEHTTETTFGGKNQKVVPSEMINEYKAIGFAVPGDKMDLVDAPNPIAIKAWWDFLTTNITEAIASFGNLFKTNIDAKISSVSGGGSGVVAHMYTVYVEGSPCADVVVIMTLDVEGLIKICSGRTNSLGQVIFYPNVPAGTTVYLWRYKSVVTFSNPDVEVIHE